MPSYEYAGRYAEDPPVIVEAATREQADLLAWRYHRQEISPGYNPNGGALCGVEIPTPRKRASRRRRTAP